MKFRKLNLNIKNSNKVEIAIIVAAVVVISVGFVWYGKTYRKDYNSNNAEDKSNIDLSEKYSSQEEAISGELDGTLYDLASILEMSRTEGENSGVPMHIYNGKEQRELAKGREDRKKEDAENGKEDSTEADIEYKDQVVESFINLTGTSLDDYDKLVVAYDNQQYLVFIAKPTSEESKKIIKEKSITNINDIQLTEYKDNIIGVKTTNNTELTTSIINRFNGVDELLKSSVIDGYNKVNKETNTEEGTQEGTQEGTNVEDVTPTEDIQEGTSTEEGNSTEETQEGTAQVEDGSTDSAEVSTDNAETAE